MVVGRQGRTINGIKNDLSLIELRVMQPNQWSNNLPWVFIQAANTFHLQKAYMEVLKLLKNQCGDHRLRFLWLLLLLNDR